MSATSVKSSPRILLAGVFGPFGVDDEYGRKENIMELFHNQVTKGQGAASFRFFHRSFGLYFLAANLDADVTVLDFPSQQRFIKEVRQGGYDIVGISFIAPNFRKAKQMARLTRDIAPDATIILGGHGAAIEGVEQLIDCDHVVKGEGIRWMRRHLGQDVDAPLSHPVLPSTEQQSIYGVPVPGPTASLLVPGVGCVNGCKFCSTTHFFGREYTSFISSGKELFQLACSIADQRGTDDFFVLDENFLKDRQRAMELLNEMEQHQRFFNFHIFSSAEAITAFGVDNMVRLGVSFVWIGVESSKPQGNYEKNVGIDPRRLVRQLRDRGVAVLASGILCAEHHTRDNIQHEVDFLVGLNADWVQFMLLTPLPVTALYREHQRKGLLREDLPFEEWHGQTELSYRHPQFPGSASERWIKRAFRQDYEVNSSSLYRATETYFRGYQRLAAMERRDACQQKRMEQLEQKVRQYAPTLPGLARFAVNEQARDRAEQLLAQVTRALNLGGVVERIKQAGATAMMARWRLRLRIKGDGIQPRTQVTRFRGGEMISGKLRLPVLPVPRIPSGPDLRVAARTMLPT